MYQKAYGIIETLAPLHVGATAGEETGNLNLIFRDQFTQTGIIPGSSIRGRLRAEMVVFAGQPEADGYYGRPASKEPDLQFESRIKMEHASIVWLPVFCPGQPIVWVSCPRLLRRYQRIAGDFVRVNKQQLLKDIKDAPSAYTGSQDFKSNQVFFNFGFVKIKHFQVDLSAWFPLETMFGHPNGKHLPAVVVNDNDMAMIHDMALYRQSRVALKKDQKVVANQAFFNVEALPEGTLLVFPIAIKPPASKKAQSDQEQTDIEIQVSSPEQISTEVQPQAADVLIETQPPSEEQAETETQVFPPKEVSKQVNPQDASEVSAETLPSASNPEQNGYAWKPFKDAIAGIYLGGLESVGFGHCYLTVKLPENKLPQK